MPQQVIISTSKLTEIADLLEQASNVMRGMVATTNKSELAEQTPKRVRPKRIPKGDEWFWSDEWQKLENEADSDIAHGHVKGFSTVEALIANLNS